MTSVLTKGGDRLDLLCWAHYGSLSGRTVEQVLEANPGISMTAELSSGMVIMLPDISAQPLEESLW